MTLLKVELDAVRFGARTVLKEVSFIGQAGVHTAVLGPNGAGKSTLVRAIAGLVPYTGEILIGGQRLEDLEPRERAQKIAYVPQASHLGAELSVHQVVMQGRYCHQKSWGSVSVADREAVRQALDMTDVAHLRDRSYLRLSGGEQKRVLLARALATDAEVILLDEPAASLDVAHVLALFECLRCLAEQGKCLVTVLHQLSDAERFCDKLVLLHQGAVHFAGPGPLPVDLLKQVYGVRAVNNAGPRYELASEEG